MRSEAAFVDDSSPGSDRDGGPPVSRAELSVLMAQVGQSLASEPLGVQDMVDRITSAAADTVPGAEQASIALLTVDGDLEVLAETDPVASEINDLQTGYRQGPRFDAAKAGQRWVSDDLRSDDRWPLLGPAIAALGINSLLTTVIASEPQRVVLNLFSSELEAFDPDDIVVELFAHHARIALGYAAELESVRRGLQSRTVIGQAVGLVMARYDLDDDHAFRYLVRMSQNGNVKLRTLAAEIVRGRNVAASKPASIVDGG